MRVEQGQRVASSRFAVAGTGLWAILDQGLFAVANFALNVLLARFLGLEAYGVFGVAFAVFQFVSTAHTAVVSEPLLVFGSGRYRDRFATYVWTVVAGHWWLMARALPVALVVSLAVWPFQPGLGASLVALTVAAPLILLQWSLRRACYVELRPRVAATAGAVYLAAILGGVFALRAVGALSPTTGLLLMGVASAASVTVILRYLRSTVDAAPPAEDEARDPRLFRAAVRHEHWRYGRWGVAAIALSWASVEVYYVMLSALQGFDATGVLRAAMNLVAPVMQTLLALSTVALPHFAQAYRDGRLMRTVRGAYAAASALTVFFALLLIAFAEPVVALLYGPDFAAAVPVVRWVALLPLTLAVTRVAATALHALERPRDIYIGYLPGAVVALSFGMLASWQWGVLGAAYGVLASGAVVAATMAWRLRAGGRPKPRA